MRFLSGNVDVGAFGSPGLLIAWEKTKGHQDVAGLAALGANAFILETNKPQIKSLADFGDNDQIAVPATTSPQAVVMRMAAEKTFGDYRRLDNLLVSMPHPDATAALLSGQIIAGYVATAPFTAILKRSDKVHVVTTSKDILGEEMTGVALGAGKKFVDANPAVARVVIAATEDGMKFIAKDPAAAADIYLKSEASKTPKDDVDRAFDRRLDRLFGSADRADEARDLHGQDRRTQRPRRIPGRTCSFRCSARAAEAERAVPLQEIAA